MKYWQNIAVTTHEQAIISPTHCFGAIKKLSGEAVTVSVIVKLLSDIIRFVSVGKSMNDYMLAETAKLILQNYYFLKIEDFKLFADYFKAGKYGQLFDRLDGQIILLALQKYADERIEVAERLSHEQHKTAIASSDEKFFLKIGKNYIREETEIEYAEVEDIELATPFSFKNAVSVKQWLIGNGEPVRIVNINKPTIGVLKWCEQHKPDMLTKELKYRSKIEAYNAAMKEINEREDLTELDKINARLSYLGFPNWTQEDYDKHLESTTVRRLNEPQEKIQYTPS